MPNPPAATPLHLIPTPKRVQSSRARFTLPPEMYVVLQPHAATRDLFPAERFVLDAEELTGSAFHIAAGQGTDSAQEIRLAHDPDLAADLPPDLRDQAYRLTISPTGIVIQTFAAPGTFYALQTLLQIIRETAYAQFGTRSVSEAGKNKKSKTSQRKTQSSALKAQHFALPCLTILDYPDFPRRGFYHDTARGKVPTVETLLQLIDDLGHLKYNEFQLYIENNFQFRKHPDFYNDTDPFTAEELLLLDAACRAQHIDFVPSLTSLGHFERILIRPKYSHLAEAEPEQLKAIGAPCWVDAPWSLCVTDPEARQLLADMYAEFAPNFSSPHFNICCDEAYDLGRVRSKAEADKVGTGQMYVDWIRYCDTLSRSHGKSIQMWGDIILNHPELISQLPENATLLEWGYEHDHKFDEHCKTFVERLGREIRDQATPETSESDVPSNASFPHSFNATTHPSPGSPSSTRNFYVSPGTASWLTLSSRSKNAFGNIHNAATAGLKYGAKGLLLTDWGDHGHQQFLAVSLVSIAYAAAASWNLAATPNPYASLPRKKNENRKSKIENPLTSSPGHLVTLSTLLRGTSFHLFQDPTAQYAALAYDLGLTYERLGWQRFNASLDHFLFREKWDFANYVNRAPEKALLNTIHATGQIYDRLHTTQSQRADAAQLAAEFFLTIRLIDHTCARTLLRKQWLAADPTKRNPEEPTLRGKPPQRLPKDFAKQMAARAQEIKRYRALYQTLWLARNKKSCLQDILVEFDRLAAEYRRFASR